MKNRHRIRSNVHVCLFGAESTGPFVYLRIVAVSGVRREQIWLLVNLEGLNNQTKPIRRPTWFKNSEELSKISIDVDARSPRVGFSVHIEQRRQSE